MYSEEIKRECLRLRVEERKSLTEIQNLTGLSKGCLHLWLKDHKLTAEEVKTRRRQNGVSIRVGRLLKKDRGSQSHLCRLLNFETLSKEGKSRVAETAVLIRLAGLGLSVYKPAFEGQKSDWVVEARGTGTLWRIQVKGVGNTKAGHGLPVVSVTCSHGKKRRRYHDREIDFIVGYDHYTDVCYVWHKSELVNQKASISISDDAKERWDKLDRQPIAQMVACQNGILEVPGSIPGRLIETSEEGGSSLAGNGT